MYDVIIEARAEQDLNEIVSYIVDTLKAPDSARRLYFKLREEIMKLGEMPQRCAPILEQPYAQMGVRKLFVANYIAFFLVEEEAKEVHILRILYNRREWHDLL